MQLPGSGKSLFMLQVSIPNRDWEKLQPLRDILLLLKKIKVSIPNRDWEKLQLLQYKNLFGAIMFQSLIGIGKSCN